MAAQVGVALRAAHPGQHLTHRIRMFGRRITSCSNTIGDAYPACGAGGKHRHTPVEEGVTGYRRQTVGAGLE
ncbi:Uncharacterised protein [Mycobacterium tuberculosis]|nr:Uncharacterised protein [Mycobacterium tuberculosis]